ncbi:TSC22 domain family protein 2 [Nannospalax galili]|uniref:TSC22 domain family protein 2 n=1 Tax=Nannospalax galili TaxID=1026970 RepID=UPI00111C303F|nr:TSC22 domain family protein 2 [Nannospalax galili]
MSKMPAKKKSCFQITSVTTAQVATSITEDTESLDDPDESRTEDVSSEIFDVSRATDYGPEEACERSSSEETLNNVGDAETPGTVSPNPVPDGQLATAATGAPANGGGGVAARSVAGALAQSLAATVTPAASAGTPAPATPSQPPATCSSRFRVIKLDHGSGEPYRRGRWTCMEYYERDSDSSVLSRSGDCIRHSSTLEQTAERDSGLGATGGSVVVVVASVPGMHGPDSGADSSVAAACDKTSVGPPPVGGAVAPGSAPPFPGAPTGMAEAVATGPGPGAPCQPAGGVVQPGLGGPPQSVPQPHVGASGQLSAVPAGPHAAVPAVANVPAALAAPGVPSVSTTSVTMPNVPAPLGQAQLSGGGSIAHAGHPVAPGTHSAPTSLPQADLSHFQTPSQPPGGPVDDTRRKSEPLPQPPLSLVADKQSAAKPPVADALANPLQLTPMNSLATSVFSIAIPVDGDEDRNPSTAFYQAFHLNTFQESKSLWDSASGGGVVAIDNKIEQAMDLVKSHLMYAVREEVEVLKEQIKELVERNSLLERENALLKSLSNNDQLSQLPAQQANPGSTSQQQAMIAQPPQPTQPPQQPNVSSA